MALKIHSNFQSYERSISASPKVSKDGLVRPVLNIPANFGPPHDSAIWRSLRKERPGGASPDKYRIVAGGRHRPAITVIASSCIYIEKYAKILDTLNCDIMNMEMDPSLANMGTENNEWSSSSDPGACTSSAINALFG